MVGTCGLAGVPLVLVLAGVHGRWDGVALASHRFEAAIWESFRRQPVCRVDGRVRQG